VAGADVDAELKGDALKLRIPLLETAKPKRIEIKATD
jgi:hypothetical protein